MKSKCTLLFSAIILLLAGCAPYKQLTPKPEIINGEQGYIELKKGKNKFEIKQDKQYFITFPGSQEPNFYLVIDLPQKGKLTTFFTDSLQKKTMPGKKIEDEALKPEYTSVYPVTKRPEAFYWIIDKVPEDMELDIRYRYAPQWRYKFENKHALFKDILQGNRVDRKTYEKVGNNFAFENFNFAQEIETVSGHLQWVNNVYKECLAIESIFPASILNSQDTAYLHYIKLKADLENELKFQNAYLAALKFFKLNEDTRGNPSGLLQRVEEMVAFFSGKKNYSEGVLKESRKVVEARQKGIQTYYEQLLSGKEDEEPFNPELYRIPEFKRFQALYDTAGMKKPEDFALLSKFANDYDEKSLALARIKNRLAAVEKVITDGPQMPQNSFFGPLADSVSAIKGSLPSEIDDSYAKYGKYSCAAALNTAIGILKKEIDKRILQYGEADQSVKQVNALMPEKEYPIMLGILKEKQHLGFLLDKYRALDSMSVTEQGSRVSESLKSFRFRQAEGDLTRLHQDQNFISPEKVAPLKQKTVLSLEDSLYVIVDRITRSRVDKFLEEKINVLEDVDSLYEDSVFLPALDITFSSGGRAQLAQRKEELTAHLAKMKENQFPAKAVKLLYKEFLNRPGDKGVLKARAVVTHGKHYKGEDKEVKRSIAECDPWQAKWIVEPTKYRRVFALPVTTKRNGPNTYLFRLNIRIPTEAKFPVYDVNMRLPQAVAEKAGEKQWFDKIKLNKELLKSEGRFTIIAPSADNNYECQITPVRMNADESNFLEVYFEHPGLQALPVSVMVQKPLIKKN